MNQAAPKLRNFARSLIKRVTRGRKSSTTKAKSPFLVCEKLRPPLATLMGNAGFRALLSRALALASQEVPWLSSLTISSGGSLGGFDELDAHVHPEDRFEGAVTLFAVLLGLLVTFIGENLTLQLVREVWPRQSRNYMFIAKGNIDEKTK